MTSRCTYAALVEVVDGDTELIARLVEEGVIVVRDDDLAIVDVDVVLVARTLWRDLALDWPGIAVILRLREQLARAQARVAELEDQLAER
ncbi:MAG: hypothetical protein IPL61_22200 [Myxococcales bacterium]|nr:hypothetical protein [Myxococcales bacterium]